MLFKVEQDEDAKIIIDRLKTQIILGLPMFIMNAVWYKVYGKYTPLGETVKQL